MKAWFTLPGTWVLARDVVVRSGAVGEVKKKVRATEDTLYRETTMGGMEVFLKRLLRGFSCYAAVLRRCRFSRTMRASDSYGGVRAWTTCGWDLQV